MRKTKKKMGTRYEIRFRLVKQPAKSMNSVAVFFISTNKKYYLRFVFFPISFFSCFMFCSLRFCRVFATLTQLFNFIYYKNNNNKKTNFNLKKLNIYAIRSSHFFSLLFFFASLTHSWNYEKI
jgi:hypothetical protein